MNKNILIVFFLFALKSFSQEKYNSENFRVTLGDIQTNSFVKDSTANAFVIYEKGDSHVSDEEYNLITKKKHKIKILNKEGFQYASVSIPLYNNKQRFEKVENIIATTYNLIDGQVIKTNLLEKDIFKEKYNENHTIVKFTMPNIKEGSVITYSYKLISPFMGKYHGWEFQSDIPKMYSEYRTSIPGNWEYHIKLVGGKKLTTNTTNIKKSCLKGRNGAYANCLNSTYAMKDIPAFIEEDYITSKSNYLSRIEYELKTLTFWDGRKTNYTKTWKDVDKEIRTDKEIGKQLKKSIEYETLLSSEIINEEDLINKAKSIYRYVQDEYTWNGNYRIFKDVSIKKLLKEKSGNVSSINILLHNLLKALGIQVKPILLSTRKNGFITKIYPVISDFNYLIVQATINGKDYLLDATDNYLNFGDIPFRCLNQYGRLLDFKQGSKWIEIKPQSLSSAQYKAELSINHEDIITGKIDSKITGYHALNSKKAYYSNPDKYLDNLENNFDDIEIQNHNITTKAKTNNDFKESYNITYNAEITGENIYINPFFIKFFKENPFKLQERTYPIDFGYKDTFFYALKLNIDDSFSILETPKNLNLSLPNNAGQVLFSSSVMNNAINIAFRINFKKAIYEPEYYPYLKEFMNKVVDLQTNSLILLKKK